MSWFISLLLAGAVLTSGNGMPTYEYQNVATNDLNTARNAAQDVTERFEKTYPFNPDGRIEVSNLNGWIKIEAWDRPEVRIVATKVAGRQDLLADVELRIDADQNSFRVQTEYKSWKNRSWSKDSNLSVNIELSVPRTATLGEIESVNGAVEVSNMTRYTEISAVNGDVRATNLRGTAKLSTVNGTVFADFDSLSDDSTIALGTVNGSVKLSVPSSIHATVKANTVNGSISNEFGLPVKKGEWVGRDLYGRIGNGLVKIKLNSVNGSLSINNKDGGITNPVVNLLPQKTSDDFDDSFDLDIEVEPEISGRVRVDVQKAMKESKKAVVAARKDVEKALREVEKEKALIDAGKLKQAIEAEKMKDDLERAREEMVRASEALYLSRRSPYVQEKTGTLAVEGTPRVTIDAQDCDVQVRGWDRPEVKYVISRIAATGLGDEDDLRAKVTNDTTSVQIEVMNDLPGLAGPGRGQVRVEVFVPKKSHLKISTNRQIRLEGVSGELELIGVNEPINVRDSHGTLKVETVDGLVRIIGFSGELESKAVDGDVYLEGDFKKICSVSVDGRVFLTMPDAADATLHTNSRIDAPDMKLKAGEADMETGMKTYRLGKGGAEYSFDFERGLLIVRPKSAIVAR